jgi:dTDP-4-amino-4,6-dideoxygalactose transaminase
MKIPFFDYPQLYLKNQDELTRVFQDVSSRGAFIMQNDLREFEDNIASFTNSKFAIGVANATDGLQMALMAGSSHKSGEIIISSHTMVATASAIHFAGFKPVPVEAGEDLMIDIESTKNAINKNTVAIMPTQLNGRTCNMDDLTKLAEDNSLEIFEDAAQALGSKFKGKFSGTFGKASAISLYPAKILGGFGDGGIVLTQDEDVYKKLLLLRDHGRDVDSGEVVSWGMNSRLDNLQAAILNFFFKNYEEVITRRRELAMIYDEGLNSIEEISLPEPPNNGDHFDVFQNYEIKAENRDQLRTYLSSCGIGSLIQWSGKAVHQFEGLSLDTKLPRTDALFNRLLMIPLNIFLDNKDIENIVKSIKSFYSKK